MSAVRRSLYRARRLAERTKHTCDLWSRLGFGWREAWRIAGTWH